MVIIETIPANVAANIIMCLIHQCNDLPDRQIGRLEQDFLKESAMRGRIYKARVNRGDKDL
ncbi:hypothetical protein CSA56_14690 [candidate division KSB3 bacterium]|uniref:Uncharacterized protein n=1 Tax=candidate division KSB3 bacterium TaxID=2044937 RepID=A0A2G6KAD6_9BACT|nr:MAG: hypothetical protein CSA56_14690 [candidate division KSB3 bacterium]